MSPRIRGKRDTPPAEAGKSQAQAAAKPAGKAAAPAKDRRPLGEILVANKVLSRRDLQRALDKQVADGGDLGVVLVAMGLTDERSVAKALSVQLGLPLVDLRHETVEDDAIKAVDQETAREGELIPIRFDPDGAIVIAIARPADADIIADIKKATGTKVRAVLAARTDILRTIDAKYTGFADVEAKAQAFKEHVRPQTRAKAGASSIKADAPVVQIVNRLIEQGVRDRASDIHLEPQEDELRVRFRIDGTLHDVTSLPREVAPALVSRIKILSDMDIVERQRPQDGQFSTEVDNQPLDVRAATTTTIWGEKIVLRLLSKGASLFKLTDLGMGQKILDPYQKLIRSAHGMIIVAGPTGSGKTTTLYATLSELDRLENNIMTIEDPVEYVFEDINQIQIRETAGISFATGLKSILRQDPDVILVGEMRDAETARIGVQSALTGHFVLSSMHATDSTSALYRFLDMGIEGFLVASSLLGVVAQRLVRRNCSHCIATYKPSPEELSFFHASGGKTTKKKFVRGAGCNFCAQTGYLGRVGIYELLIISEVIKQLVVDHVSHDHLRAQAVKEGLHTLLKDAMEKIEEDQTTIGEVLRKMYVA